MEDCARQEAEWPNFQGVTIGRATILMQNALTRKGQNWNKRLGRLNGGKVIVGWWAKVAIEKEEMKQGQREFEHPAGAANSFSTEEIDTIMRGLPRKRDIKEGGGGERKKGGY